MINRNQIFKVMRSNTLLVLCFTFVVQSWAESNRAKATQKKPASNAENVSMTEGRGRLKKDIDFDGAEIRGQYRGMQKGVSTVEEDKVLDGLIGVRKDFNDRLKESEKQF